MDTNIEPPIIPEPIQPSPLNNNYTWLRTITIGFSIVSFCIAIAALGYLWTIQNKIPQKQTQVINPTSVPTPTPDPTANWKTYSNAAYSFKYPNEWYLEKPVNSLSFFQLGTTPIHSTSGKFGNETLIIIDYSVAKFEDLKNNTKNTDGSPVYTETTFSNKRVLKAIQLMSADILLSSLNNGNDRILNLRVIDNNNLSLLDKILSTFKFTQ